MAFDAKIKLVVDKSSRTSLKKEIDETLKSINGNVVIKSFDGSKAAAKLKADIEQKLNGISIDVKVNQKIGNKNSTAGIMSSLKSQIKSLEQSHSKLLNSGVKDGDAKELEALYAQINNSIDKINKNQSIGTEQQKKIVQEIDKEVLAYNRKTNAVIENAKKEKAATEELRVSQEKVQRQANKKAVANNPENKIFQQELKNLDKSYNALGSYASKNLVDDSKYNATIDKYKEIIKLANEINEGINRDGINYLNGEGKGKIDTITSQIKAYETEANSIIQTGKAAESAAKVKSQAATQETLSLKREISLLDQMSKYYEKNSKLQGTSIGNKLQGIIGEIESSVASGKKLSTNELNSYTCLHS